MNTLVVLDVDSALTHALRRAKLPAHVTHLVPDETLTARLARVHPGALLMSHQIAASEVVQYARRVRNEPLLPPMRLGVISGTWTEQERDEVGRLSDLIVSDSSLKRVLDAARTLLRIDAPSDLRDDSGTVISVGRLQLHLEKYLVTLGGKYLASLTAGEYAMLRTLMRHHDTVVSIDRIAELSGTLFERPTTRTVRSHVARLRSKLKPTGVRIESIRGGGYQLVTRDDAGAA